MYTPNVPVYLAEIQSRLSRNTQLSSGSVRKVTHTASHPLLSTFECTPHLV